MSRATTDRKFDADAAMTAEAEARIARAVSRARLTLIWERAWPLAAPFLVLAAVFASVSWLGLWRVLSLPLRYTALAGFAAALVWCLANLRHFRIPGRTDAFGRVERATGAAHRPATALTDRLASGPGNATAEALWLAHRRRALAALTRLRAGMPSPGLTRRDPFALRFLVVLVFAVSFLAAGSERIDRLAEAFRGGETPAALLARIDAWVAPPAYTGRPPIFLTGAAMAAATSGPLTVPAGSIVTVRIGGADDLTVTATADSGTAPEVKTLPRQAIASRSAIPPTERQVALATAGTVSVTRNGRAVADWHFAVDPDKPPAIAIVGTPDETLSGGLHLSYSLQDDYGVVAAYAEFAPTSAARTDARPLFEAPKMTLNLPQFRIRNGTGETTRDLSSHPWAGAKVTMTLVARDEAGQEGRSVPIEVTLPTRPFTDPLARALVEQRAALALDANAGPAVTDALNAFTLLPEKGIDEPKRYLAVRSAFYRSLNAANDDDLRALADYLWQIAVGIEDGDLSFSAEDLRAAQDALQKALENGASDAEIARLTEALRQAMDKFLKALVQQALQNPNAQPVPPNANVQTLSPDDLSRMLDRIEELAKTGARDAARQLLSQLQEMMQNLQMAQRGQADPNASQMMQSLSQLGDMIRRQEDLMNRTYRAQRGMNPDGSGTPMTKEQLEQALKDLAEQQQQLAQSLSEMMEQLNGQGADGQQPGDKLGQAGRAMGRAGEALRGSNPGGAVEQQGLALENLRQGAQALQQQFANGSNPGGRGGRGYGNNLFPNTDPLGRPQQSNSPDLGSSVKIPDEIDTQRAREILDAIRRRLGETGRSLIEREYLERLLEQF